MKNLKNKAAARKIKSVHCRRILNSHVEFVYEFVVELEDGSVGIGSMPKGETISVYEKNGSSQVSWKIIEQVVNDEILNVPLSQEEFDTCLQRQSKILGIGNCYALSLAFFDADERSRFGGGQDEDRMKLPFPHICLNLLNGGRHAYTNPILCDFPEFLLVSRSDSLGDIINDHDQLQRRIREEFSTFKKVVVNGNVVNKGRADNRDWIEFLMSIVGNLHLASKYDLMLDASAGDLWTGKRYNFSLTDGSTRTTSEMCDYWLDLINSYEISFLEDPFHERDFGSWIKLSGAQGKCKVIGDNLYNSDPLKIREGIKKELSDGVIIKPDQAGTVTATVEAIKAAQKGNQIIMTSHRSISTESTFLSKITKKGKIDYIKIGPLNTDYSSIVRLNELIRLYGIGYE